MDFDLSLYLVTDHSLLAGRDLAKVVCEAVQGGVTMVQLREKTCDTKLFIEEAIQLREMLTSYDVPLIINDRVDVALAADADGVHIGQSDMPYDMARKLMGPHKIIGLSVENMNQLTEANAMDVDYIGISPVFATPTKTDTARPFGLEGLQHAVAMSRHRTVAIGGINKDNLPEVMATGVDGVAVVSAIMASNQPMTSSIMLSEIVKKSKLA